MRSTTLLSGLIKALNHWLSEGTERADAPLYRQYGIRLDCAAGYFSGGALMLMINLILILIVGGFAALISAAFWSTYTAQGGTGRGVC